MSRLHDPSLGDIIDRLTILALKQVYGKQAGRETTHWSNEYEALLDRLDAMRATETGRDRQLVRMVLAMAAVNAALWQAEDAIRELRPSPTPLPPWDPVKEAEQLAFRIADLNDRRAQLVQQINADAGQPTPEEKL